MPQSSENIPSSFPFDAKVGTVELPVFRCSRGPSPCETKSVRCGGCLGNGFSVRLDGEELQHVDVNFSPTN